MAACIVVIIPILIKIKNKNKGNGKIGLDSSYKRVKYDDPDFFYIPIVATNNIQGKFYQEIKKNIYKFGGLEYLSRYINILRDEFGKNRVLYLDAGEYYNKEIENNNNINNKIDKFFNYIDLKATILDESYVNIKKEINNQNYLIFSDVSERYKIYKIQLINGDIINIGVIGIYIKKDKNYLLDELAKNITLYIKELREKGANGIILLSNLDIQCIDAQLKLDIISNHEQLCDKYSTSNTSILRILEKSEKKPDVVIICNSNNIEIHHWEQGIPIMSSPWNGKYFNIMYLPFKKNNNNNYILNKNEIKIEGPLPICEKIFRDTKICDDIIESKTNELITYSWHDKKIYKDPNFKI